MLRAYTLSQHCTLDDDAHHATSGSERSSEKGGGNHDLTAVLTSIGQDQGVKGEAGCVCSNFCLSVVPQIAGGGVE